MKTILILLTLVAAAAADDVNSLKTQIDKLERRVAVLEGAIARLTQTRNSPAKAEAVNPRIRHWTFLDGSELDAEFVDFAGGEAVLVDDIKTEHRVKTSDLSAVDRKWVQDEVKARTEVERAKKAGYVVDCPNKNCKRGVLYGPVSGGGVISNGGRSQAIGVSGVGPVGTCPTCHGRGVVPNPARR